MFASSRKFIGIALLFALGSVAIVANSDYRRSVPLSAHSQAVPAESADYWDFAANWFDGHNIHPYVKIKSTIDENDCVSHVRDNATGLPIFEEISAEEFDSRHRG